jgi:thioredoxin 2
MEIKCPHCGRRNRAPAHKFSSAPDCGACGQPLLNGPIDVGPAALSELISDSPVPVLVDFWAPWCGPCRVFAPTFKAAAAVHGGPVIFAKVDTEAHREIALQYNIRSIPTLASFSKGKEIGRVTGALPAAELEKLVGRLKQ